MTRPADLVLLGRVWTGVAGHGAGGVAVTGDRIVAVGTRDEALALAGPSTWVREVHEGLITPGFQDAHVHAPFAGRHRLTLSLLDLDGREAYLRAVAAYAAAHPARPWITGGGWAMEHFPGGIPHRDDLDRVVPDRPVFLFNRDTHGAWVNSTALRIAGLDETTPDPADGRYERDADGRLTGMLHEGAAYAFHDHVVPPTDRDDWMAAILEAQGYLHALGITAWQDAWVTPDTLVAYARLAAEGRLSARVVGALWWDRHRGLEQLDDLVEQRASVPRGRFRPTTVKIMVDGVLENQTGALLQPYCDGCGGTTGSSGLQFIDTPLLFAALDRLTALGFQVHLHTIGDRAVRLALDAIESARERHGPHDLRHQLAHVQIVQPEDVPRFRRLDVVANCQTFWAQSEPQMDELTVPFVGADRAARMYPFGDLLRHGTVLAMGSDWPVTTADPLQQMEVAVTRVDPEHRENPPLLPDQAIPPAAALAGFTRGAAFASHDDGDAGTITVGRRADLVVLDRDILGQDAGPLADARVQLTVASGRIVHDGGLTG